MAVDTMRVVVTGAGGTLGTALAPALANAGHEPVLFDTRPIQSEFECFQGDICTSEDVGTALRGTDLVVHAAALHGEHLADHSAREFLDLNVAGTFNLWEAAVRAGVCGLVFCSTMGVYKVPNKPLRQDAVVALREDVTPLPANIYGFTKLAGEEMCRYFGREHGIPSVALRFGMFSPEPFFRYGIRLLYGGVDTDDVVRAVMASIDPLRSGEIRWDVFNVESLVPFSQDDDAGMREDPLAVLDKYYPGSAGLLRDRGVERLQPIYEYYPMEHAARRLGFQPRCNFDRWLRDLEAHPAERAEKNPPWP